MTQDKGKQPSLSKCKCSLFNLQTPRTRISQDVVPGVSEPALQTNNREQLQSKLCLCLESRRLERKFPQDLPALAKINTGDRGQHRDWESGGLGLVLALLMPKAESDSIFLASGFSPKLQVWCSVSKETTGLPSKSLRGFFKQNVPTFPFWLIIMALGRESLSLREAWDTPLSCYGVSRWAGWSRQRSVWSEDLGPGTEGTGFLSHLYVFSDSMLMFWGLLSPSEFTWISSEEKVWGEHWWALGSLVHKSGTACITAVGIWALVKGSRT